MQDVGWAVRFINPETRRHLFGSRILTSSHVRSQRIVNGSDSPQEGPCGHQDGQLQTKNIEDLAATTLSMRERLVNEDVSTRREG